MDVYTYRQINVSAGYESENKTALMFRGNISEAFSYRQGADWITEIDAQSGLYAKVNGKVSMNFPSNFSLTNVLESLGAQLPGVKVKTIANIPAIQSSRGKTIVGNTWDEINALVSDEYTAYIDNELFSIEDRSKVDIQPGQKEFFINSDSGLLDTPRRYENTIKISILFEPDMNIGDVVNVTSEEKLFNGKWKVVGIEHQGTISGAVGGDCRTIITGYSGLQVVS